MTMGNRRHSSSHARNATTPEMSRNASTISGERDGSPPHFHFLYGGLEDCSKNIATIFNEKIKSGAQHLFATIDIWNRP
jgi:hypothetical protein